MKFWWFCKRILRSFRRTCGPRAKRACGDNRKPTRKQPETRPRVGLRAICFFLDDDIEAPPDLLAGHAAAFEDPRLGAACGAILEPGQTVTDEIPDYVARKPLGWARFPLHYGAIARTRNFSSCHTCVRREIHEASGGFDAHFVATIYDDSDWSLRLCRVLEERKLEGRHLGHLRLIHFREPAGGRRIRRVSTYVKVDAEGWASRFYFWRKNYGWKAWCEFLKFFRLDLICGSLAVRPAEMLRAYRELFEGWRRAASRLKQGPCLMEGEL